MILFFTPGGRTGNQLFQIAYAVSRRRNHERIVTFGFGNTKAMLAGDWKKNWLNIDNRILRKFAERFVYRVIFKSLDRTGLVTALHDGKDKRQGKIRSFTIMKGFFESSNLQAPNLSDFFRLKESIRSRVKPILDSVPDDSIPIFVHIRRSDLMHLPGGRESPKKMLPDGYYVEAVERFRSRHPNSFFVLVGDDPDHAEVLFHYLTKKVISRRSVAEDLALMSLCDGGVLSNSTFAWWGAFFGKGRRGYIAPKYWDGWAIKEWVPPDICAEFMTELIDI